MKRYSSIDFLRGLAIFMMLVLHTINDTLNVGYLTGEGFGDVSLFQTVLVILLPYLGGLAGFFLMVSSVGNMISMQKFLKRGNTPIDLIKRQIMGGFLLIVFAHLVEGPLGYHGSIGQIFRHLNDVSTERMANAALQHAFHFETIHTIAWCVLANGITHGLLVMIHGLDNLKKIMKSYVILAGVILLLTPFAWIMVENLMPGIETGQNYPYVGRDSFGYILKMFFLAPMGGHPEPLFPYLAASYIGSIFGMYITQEKKKITANGLKKFSRAAWITFLVGTIGLVSILVVLMSNGYDALGIYPSIWDHRSFFDDLKGTPFGHLAYWGWIFQFLSLNGFGLGLIVNTMRLVEYRGKGKDFAEKTVIIRRFGFVAFTIYTIQFIYHLWIYIVTVILQQFDVVVFGQAVGPYTDLNWPYTLLVMFLAIGSLHLLLKQWEKVGFIGSLEWMVGTIASVLIPGKKRPSEEKKIWWKRGQLNVDGAFYNAEWLNFRDKEEINHEALEESKRAKRLAKYGFIFFPIPLMVLGMIKQSIEKEGENEYNNKAKIMSYVQIGLWIVFVVVLSLIPNRTLGL